MIYRCSQGLAKLQIVIVGHSITSVAMGLLSSSAQLGYCVIISWRQSKQRVHMRAEDLGVVWGARINTGAEPLQTTSYSWLGGRKECWERRYIAWSGDGLLSWDYAFSCKQSPRRPQKYEPARLPRQRGRASGRCVCGRIHPGQLHVSSLTVYGYPHCPQYRSHCNTTQQGVWPSTSILAQIL